MMKVKTFILVMLLAFTAFPAIAERCSILLLTDSVMRLPQLLILQLMVVRGPDQAVVTVPSTVVFNKRTFRVTGIGSEAFS
jgi:hypothetical protein